MLRKVDGISYSDLFLESNSDGNNVLHLAILSDDQRTIETVTAIMADSTHLNMLKKQKNKGELTPSVLAFQRGLVTAVCGLQPDNLFKRLSQFCPLFREYDDCSFNPVLDENGNISIAKMMEYCQGNYNICLLYTSPSPRDRG